MRTIPMLLILALPMIAAPATHGQTAVEVVGRKEPIPLGFKTYSLFLICNPAWLDPAKSAGLTELYQQFQAFGRSIGDDQAAIWFWRTTVQKGWENHLAPADAIDVERSVRFCKAWKLKPSDGPFLVITSARPDETNLSQGLPDGSAVFQLGNLNPTQITSLLGKLTDALLLDGKVVASTTTSSSPPPLAADGTPTSLAASPNATASSGSPAGGALWIRMLSATQQIIDEFGCAVSLKVDAGPLSADLKSCKGSS